MNEAIEEEVEEQEEEECPKCPPVGAPAWMATFADMATLLMAFFVLILSFAEFNVPKFKQISGSLKNAFGVQRIIPIVEQPKGTTVLRIRDFSRRGARQVHEATLRNGQPFALRLVLDRDRLGCYFVRNSARIKFRGTSRPVDFAHRSRTRAAASGRCSRRGRPRRTSR